MLERLRAAGLAKGETVGVDATPLEAHAALSTLQRRSTQEGSGEFLERLAQSAGLETPTQAELLECDRRRQNQSLAHQEGEHPVDPDARVARRQDGAPDRAPQAEPAVDLDSGALGGLTVQAADRGDPATLGPTLEAVAEAQGEQPQTVVADQGCPSGAPVPALEESGQEPVLPEPQRKPRQGEPGRKAERTAGEAHRERGCRLAAAGPPAGPQQRPEATAHPRLRVQLGRPDAVADGDRYAPKPARRRLPGRCGANLARRRPREGPGTASARVLERLGRPAARAHARSLVRRSLRCVPPRLGGNSDSAIYQQALRELLVFPPLHVGGLGLGGAPLRREREPPQAPAHRGGAQDAAKLFPKAWRTRCAVRQANSHGH